MSAVRTAGAAFCPRCGEAQPPDAHFCPRCSLDLGGIAIPSAPDSAIAGPPAPPPVAPAPPSVVGAPSVVGRRASGVGWVVVAIGVLAMLGAAIALVVSQAPTAPLAAWDRGLSDGTTVRNDVPFDIEVTAANRAAGPTDPVWMIIDWRPDDRAFDPDAVGRFVACDPADCRFRDDADGRTLVYWPGIPAGERRVYLVSAAVTGLEPGTTFEYRVTTGTGPDEGALAGGSRWSLDLEVEP